jgi:S-adenosylmethionine-diacylglycerol 3-amino-3-carboxypropyl transferase
MSKKYFTGLNYTLGNEDTTVEIEMVKRLKPKSIFSVCGSGGRSLPLSGDAENLTLSDLSKEQIQLAKLREATYRQLSHTDFLCFWGYFPYAENNYCLARKNMFSKLELENDVHRFFQNIFSEIGFYSLLYLGKWERTFQIIAKTNSTLLGKNFDQILRFDDLEAQREYYKKSFPINRWKAVVSLLGNKALFNALLYKGNFIQKNAPESHFDYYFNAFERLFTKDLAQNSFFVQLCFYGRIRSLEGVPVEAGAEAHKRISSSKTKTNYIVEDLVTHLQSGKQKYDFLSLSDVPSYFKGELEKKFMQTIRAGLNPEAIVVNRYYLRKSDCNLEGFVDVSDEYKDLISAEKVQMYNICVYRYQP